MSLDGLIIDEAKFIDFERLKDETFQANRGNQMYFGKCYLHHGMTITSDMPVTKKGSWFLNYEKQMDQDIKEVVEGIIYKIWQLRRAIQKNPERKEFYRARIRNLQATANGFGANLHYTRSIPHSRILQYSVRNTSMT